MAEDSKSELRGRARWQAQRSIGLDDMSNQTTLVVGIGSDHGDDRVGWHVAKQLAQRSAGALSLRLARVPADLLDWLADVERLLVCDAFCAERPTPSIQHWRWPAETLRRAPRRTTHGFELPDVLDLAQRLGQLPACVDIWGIHIESAAPGEGLSARAETAIVRAVARIEADLANGLYRHA